MKQPLIKQPKTIKPVSRKYEYYEEPKADQIRFKAAMAEYMNSWQVGDLVQYGRGKWSVLELEDHAAVLASGSIRLRIRLFDNV